MWKYGKDLKAGDKIKFWCFGETYATIESVFSIKTPYPFICGAMKLSAIMPDGKYKSIESSIESENMYECE
jgi:hypothetical protein